MNTSMPPRSYKWFFWLILAAYSTFFAEVFAGSDLFPYFHIWGVLAVVPLYGLHSLILLTLIYRLGRPCLSTLVFAGMLFGLYEAYLTKVLWVPGWGDSTFGLGSVAIVETLVLVFWWHVWFAFISPLLMAEHLLTSSRDVLKGLPPVLKRFFGSWKGYAALAIFGAIFQSVNSPSVDQSLLSAASAAGLLAVLTRVWQCMTRKQAYALADLLPNRGEVIFLSLCLGAVYVFMTLAIQPERIPGLGGQALIWVFYALVISMFVRALRKSRSLETVEETIAPYQHQFWLPVVLLYILVNTLTEAVLGRFSTAIAFTGFFAGSLFGVSMFIQSIRETRKLSA